jgi:hypothetical protein
MQKVKEMGKSSSLDINARRSSALDINALKSSALDIKFYFEEPLDLPRDRNDPNLVAYNDELYAALYPDLRELSPSDRAAHYLEKGIYEGRIGTYRQFYVKVGPELYYHFDHISYLECYEDLQAQFTEKDRYALLLHYVTHGQLEHRKDCRVSKSLVPINRYWEFDSSDDDDDENSSE